MNEIGTRTESTKPPITWRGIVIIIISVLLVIFALQNLQTVSMTLYFWTLTLPVGIIFLGSLVIGVLLGGLIKRGARKLRKPKPEEVAK